MIKINRRLEKLENRSCVDSEDCIDCAALSAEIYASLPIFQDIVHRIGDVEGVDEDVDDQEKDG